jgi:hypothetical protein
MTGTFIDPASQRVLQEIRLDPPADGSLVGVELPRDFDKLLFTLRATDGPS